MSNQDQQPTPPSPQTIHQTHSTHKRDRSHCEQSDSYDITQKYTSSKSMNQELSFTCKCSNDNDNSHDNSNLNYQHQPENQEEPERERQLSLSVIEQQQSIASSMPMRQRHSHLLANYQAATFTTEQLKIIQVQLKIDQMLNFLKLHRGRARGEYFSVVRRRIREACELTIEIQQLRQILFLIPDFYCYSPREDKRYDVMISLPEFSDIESRKNQFRKRMHEYLIDKASQGVNNKNQKIPCFNFPFDQKQQNSVKQQLISAIASKNSILLKLISPSTSTFNPLDAFKPNNSQFFQKNLLMRIKEKQRQIEQKRIKDNEIQFGIGELLGIYDEIPKIYKKRSKSSMFKSSLVQDLDKSLNMKTKVLSFVFDVLLDRFSEFFKIIEHKSGQIIQINLKIYNEVREKIIKSDIKAIIPSQPKEDEKVEKNNENINQVNEAPKSTSSAQPSRTKQKQANAQTLGNQIQQTSKVQKTQRKCASVGQK